MNPVSQTRVGHSELPRTKRSVLFDVVVAAVPFAVYLRTMAPTVYGLDSAELTTGAYLLGVVHAPGSPFYLLVAHLFTWLPIGDVGLRVNLFSAVTAALALVFVYRLVVRLTGDAWTAVGAAWSLGFSYYYWAIALFAELYAPQACLVGALLCLAISWHDRSRLATLCAFGLVFGLALATHLSTIMLAPGFLWLLWSRELVTRRRAWAAAGALSVAAGVAVYLYIPLRTWAGTPYNYPLQMGVDPGTLSGFWWVISGQMFADRFLGVGAERLPIEVWLFATRLWSNFLGVPSLLGLMGAVVGFSRWPRIQTSLALMFAGHVAFIVTYDVIDKELMLVPAYLIWVIWMAVGAESTVEYVARRTGASIRIPSIRIPAWALLGALAVVAMAANWSYLDLSDDWSARDRGEAIFEHLEPEALFVGGWMDVPILEYLQLVELSRPDVETVNVFLVRGQPLTKRIRNNVAAGWPVYSSLPEVLRAAGVDFRYQKQCGCYRARLKAPDDETCSESPDLWFDVDPGSE